jgi:hypothetical protein
MTKKWVTRLFKSSLSTFQTGLTISNIYSILFQKRKASPISVNKIINFQGKYEILKSLKLPKDETRIEKSTKAGFLV